MSIELTSTSSVPMSLAGRGEQSIFEIRSNKAWVQTYEVVSCWCTRPCSLFSSAKYKTHSTHTTENPDELMVGAGSRVECEVEGPREFKVRVRIACWATQG